MARIELLEQLLAEGEQNDNMVLGILRKGGVGDHITVDDLPDGTEDTAKVLKDAQNQYRRGILERIKATPISNAENAPVLGRYQNGKNMLPVAKWWVSMKDDRDPLHGISDAVRKVYELNTTRQTAEQRGLDYYYNQFSDIKTFLQWLDKEAQRPENEVKPVQKELGAYDFPDLEVYSDANVDVYKADTPKEAIELGNGYSFCISSRGGGNQFYTYRFGTHPAWGAKQKTSCYFVWFKGPNGEKTWKDMIVVHVGENGKYLVTPARNGLFPWRSKSYVLENYPQLQPALPYMVYKKPSDQEELSAKFSSGDTLTYEPVRANKSRARIPYDNVARYTPEQLEMVVSLDVRLDDKAFDYIFETIDGKDLVKGNHGNSLIKKYIEIGNSELTDHQKQVLTDVGYGKEVERALLVSARNKLNHNFQRSHIYKGLSDGELEIAIRNATDEELNSNGKESALVWYLIQGKRNCDKVKELLVRRGHPELAYRCEELDTKLLREINNRSNFENYKLTLRGLIVSDFQYIFNNPDKFNIKPLVNMYFKAWLDYSQMGSTTAIPERIADFLKQHGYGEQVDKTEKQLKKERFKRWTLNNSNWRVEKESNGYVFTTDKEDAYYLFAPYLPKTLKRIQLNGGYSDGFQVSMSSPVKKLPLIVDRNGKPIKFSKLSFQLASVESFEQTKITYDNLKDTGHLVIDAPKLKNLRGLPPVKPKMILTLECGNASLEGLNSGDYSLRLRELGSMKGMPKKLANLQIEKDVYEDAKDRQMPDEVTDTFKIEFFSGTIDILPKKVGFLDLSRLVKKITVKECELGSLPTIRGMAGLLSWYRARSNESVLRATAERDLKKDADDAIDFTNYGGYFFGKGIKTDIPNKDIIYCHNIYYDTYHYGTPIYVHPFVTSLEGLKVPYEIVEGKEGTDPADARSDILNPCMLVVFNSKLTSLKGLPQEGFKSVFLYNCPLMEDVSAVTHTEEGSEFTLYVGAGCKKLTRDILKDIDNRVNVRRALTTWKYEGLPEIDRSEFYFFEWLSRLSTILNGLYD